MMPVILLYHAKAIGPICRRVAAASQGKIHVICDRVGVPAFKGTVIRWDTCKEVEADDVVNSAQSVVLSRNKGASRARLRGLCPPTWFTLAECRYPCIIRPKRHYAAHKFFVCHDSRAVANAVRRCGVGWYASPIIDKIVEYRVFVFRGYVIKVVRRTQGHDPAQIAWNYAAGGHTIRVKPASWPIPVVSKAILAGQQLGLDWFAADVIVDKDANIFVLELNTAPGLKRKRTIEMCAVVFASSQKTDTTGATWQTLIHPSLR